MHIKVFYNANIFTASVPSKVQAMAFEVPQENSDHTRCHGRILAVGSNDDVLEKFTSLDADIVNNHGATILPTFTDSHIHLSAWGKQLSEPNLDQVTSLDECLSILQCHKIENSRDPWLHGGGWNWNLWREGRLPTREDLDAIFPQIPVVLKSKDCHTLWCNTAALQRLNFFDAEYSFSLSTVERDYMGIPTGIIREQAAFFLMGQIPQSTNEQKTRAILRAQAKLFSLGIASVHSVESFEDFLLIRELAEQGRLKIRVSVYILEQDFDQVALSPQSYRLATSQVHIAGIKVFADGSLGSQTAFLLEPYTKSTSCGVSCITKEHLQATIGKAEKLSLSCAIHAIGDAANRMALDAISACKSQNSTKNLTSLHHRIEHCQLVHPSDISKFGANNVVASVQPTHLISDIELIEKYWQNRTHSAYPFRSLTRAHAQLIFGSDAPVEQPNPLASMHAAITRTRQIDNRSLCKLEEGISFDEALAASTTNPENVIGSIQQYGNIEPEKFANFICLDSSIDLSNPEELPRAKIGVVYCNGYKVFEENQTTEFATEEIN